jgi:hypothetical protein
MIFLIEYSREKGRIIRLQEFEDSEQADADSARLNLEMKFVKDDNLHEIVLLQAHTLDALKRTHRRYFENLEELAESRGSEL